MTKSRKVSIRFTTDKNGKRRAHYWGLARRWLPIGVDAAELKLATGEATPHETTSTNAALHAFEHTSVDGDIFDRKGA